MCYVHLYDMYKVVHIGLVFPRNMWIRNEKPNEQTSMENECFPIKILVVHPFSFILFQYFVVIHEEFSQTNKVDSFIMMTMVLYTTTLFINSIELLTQ